MNSTEHAHYFRDWLEDEGFDSGCPCLRRKHDSTRSSSDGYSTSSESSDVPSFGECEQCYGQADSLTLALQELRSKKFGASFFETHQLIGDSSDEGSDELLELQAHKKRSSSLKSKNAPPGTSNQVKKAVRFADTFGLDLAYVRHVIDRENPPIIPPQAMRHLDVLSNSENFEASDQVGQQPHSSSVKLIVSNRFAQPGDSVSFVNRVAGQKVMLERASATAEGHIEGLIRVSNLGFEKHVSVCVTYDAWASVKSIAARHVFSARDGASDQFRFELSAPRSVGERLDFCIKFSVGTETYWDNNFGENYSFDCYALSLIG